MGWFEPEPTQEPFIDSCHILDSRSFTVAFAYRLSFFFLGF